MSAPGVLLMTTYSRTDRTIHVAREATSSAWMGRLLRGAAGAIAALAFASGANAANVLKDITFTPGAGGAVDVVMSLDAPPADPKLFATESPARIAVDFEDTRNGMASKRVPIGIGSATAASAVEAGGRTRVVIELTRSTSYTTRASGNTLVVSLSGASVTSASGASVGLDPSKQVAGAHTEISNIDFRRGKAGEGRIIISFNGSGASIDLDKQGSKVLLNISNATLPDSLARKLDVTDFATPAVSVETRPRAGGAKMEIGTNGDFESLAYQTGNEYVVEIAPVKEVSPAAKALAEPEYTGERVTFNFQDIPVRSVLQLIADVSQLNIVVADSVSGNVTLRLVNVPWDQAMDIILQAKGLDKRKRGNVLWVAPTKDIADREQALADARIALEDRVPLVSEYIPINYGKAKDIATLITDTKRTNTAGSGGGASQGGAGQQTNLATRTGFLSVRGSVTFDERTNTLLISDTPAKVAEVKELIRTLDRAVDQVLIESRVVLANESFGRDLGARFGVTGGVEDKHGNVIVGGGTITGTGSMVDSALANRLAGRSTGLPVTAPSLADRLAVNLPAASAGATSYALSILGQDYILDLELSALQQEGRGQIITSPKVITSNQREADILQNEQVGYVTETPATNNAGPTRVVNFKDVVLELKVTPTITQDNRIFLNLNVQRDQVASFVTVPGLGQIPNITSRKISTGVLVENGQTVVLGGIYQFQDRKDMLKVPFLGDVPIVGNLFKSTTTTNSKAELLIFVTPKILGDRKR